MKRIGIFCLYSPVKEVDTATLHTIKEFKSIVSCLIVVINGIINNKDILDEYADEVLERENIGFDIGAFKSVILSSKYMNRIRNGNELILCNSSFFGPFIPLERIMKDMEKSDADFWGISSVEKNLVLHIQSYFIVFRQNILRGEELFYYLEKNVDVKKLDYYDVCSVFENGLFAFLKKSGYQYDAYKRDISCNNYTNPFGSVSIDNLPILKKKIFSNEFYEKDKAMDALSYIKKTYNYDINLIVDSVHHVYGIDLKNNELDKTIKKTAEKDIIQKNDMVDIEDVERFIDSQERVLIYGNGGMAKHIFSVFFFFENKSKLEGFVVSDTQKQANKFFKGYKVYNLSEIENISDKAILVALNKENTEPVMKILSDIKGVKEIKTLWKESRSYCDNSGLI